MVIRQSRLHLVDLAGGVYPMQAIVDIVLQHLADINLGTVCEIGCSVGRLTGTIAQLHPQLQCYGVDYSYQMLRQAQRYWLEGRVIEINDEHLGYSPTLVPARTPLSNLSLLLADAGDLPFGDETIDILISSFTIDRLDDPIAALNEWYRILRSGGYMVLATPLNWQASTKWRDIPDGKALADRLTGLGLHVRDRQEITIKEPIDARGNYVSWLTEVVVARKV